jgi:myo-inositol-1(or 4)-monophosphatase
MEKVFALLRAAGRLMTDPAARTEISVKGRSDFVTDRDVAVQEFIRKGLTELYPDYGFMSEEQENRPDYTKPLWILDPIDGTANFITHYRQSAVSLALYRDGKVVFGVVYNPFSEEMFTAELGKGAYVNGSPIRADNEVELPRALIDLGTAPYYKDRADEVGRLATAIILRASDLRRIGSAALAVCYAADGRTAAAMECILQPWDFAAAGLIATEAGAVVSDWQGNPLQYDKPCSVLVAGTNVYNDILKMIKEVTEQ